MKLARQQYRKVKVADLKPHPRNPRRGDVEAIKESIDANDFVGAIVVQKSTGYVLVGNHRLKVARAEGATNLPAMVVDVDDETALRIMLADNATSDRASYEDRELHDLLHEIGQEHGTLEGTGFAFDDLKALERDLTLAPDPIEEDEPPALPTKPRSRLGQIYELGPHRLMCGDCRNPDDVAKLLGETELNLAITSPPYADRRNYDKASGFRPIPPEEYVDWFEAVQANVSDHLAGDGSWFVNIKAGVTPDGLDTELYVLELVLAHARSWGWHFATEFCWERVGVPKNVTRRFKNQFEPIYQFTKSDWKMRPDAVRHASDHVPRPGGPGVGNTGWQDAQGGNGPIFGAAKKRKSNIIGAGTVAEIQGGDQRIDALIGPGLAYPGNRLPTFTHTHEATGHTAAFPVGLPAFFIRAYSDAGDTVYDPFMGSGSTLLAAEASGRIAFGMEISPAYCDVIRDRYAAWVERAAA